MIRDSGVWLVVGLGNPGRQYARTRHNLGARVVEAFRNDRGQPAFRTAAALAARVSRGEHLLAIPTTFMNESGRAVRALVKKFRIPLDRLLLVHDDKDLAFGQSKLQRGRSSAGHRGVQSIIDTLGTNAFWRLRVGIGKPPPRTTTEAFVLQPFSPVEEAQLPDSIAAAVRRLLRAPYRDAPVTARGGRGDALSSL